MLQCLLHISALNDMLIDHTIKTERLLLAPLTLDDANNLHELWTHPGVRRYLWDDIIIPFEQTATIIETSINGFHDKGHGLWGVRLANKLNHNNTAQELIGFCGFWEFFDPPILQLLYGIAANYWNHGYATECAQAMVHYGFHQLGFQQIRASTDLPNVASIRVLENIGMHLERQEEVNGLETTFYRLEQNT